MSVLHLFRHRRLRRRQAPRISVGLASRLRIAVLLLGLVTVAHIAAMQLLEGMSLGQSIWLTLTTMLTVGYGDLSAQTTAGRTATIVLMYFGGILILAQVASDYIDFRLQRKFRMIRGQWRWKMKDHILIINAPDQDPENYFRQLVGQIRETEEYADSPVQIITDAFADGLPDSIRDLGVVHRHGEPSRPGMLEEARPEAAAGIIVLARSTSKQISDSVTLDILMQLRDMGSLMPRIVAERVSECNRDRFRQLGVSASIRPIRAYPEIMVRSLVAPGSETVLENLFRHDNDRGVRYDIDVRDRAWGELVCAVMMGGLGTLIAYLDDAGRVECQPEPDKRISAKALIVIARSEWVGDEHALAQAISR